MPELTHLAFNYEVPLEVVGGALECCNALRVLVSLVFHYPDDPLMESSESVQYTGVTERRVVYLSQPAKGVVPDWLAATRGRMDFWKFAEDIISKRSLQSPVPVA